MQQVEICKGVTTLTNMCEYSPMFWNLYV